MKRSYEYENGYVLDFIIFPGRYGSAEENESLLQIIREINTKGMKLDYGIFKLDLDRALLNNMIICLIKKGEEYHGFFYAVVVDEQIPLVHQGLIMLIKNDGVDLLTNPYHLLNTIIFEQFQKPFFATNITAMPKSIGSFCDLFSDVWPSPYADQLKCKFPEYRSLLDTLKNEYVKKIFTEPGQISIDKNRFVLKSKVKQMGFETDFHKLARDSRFEINMFTFMWLKHAEEEDIVQVGKYDQSNYDRTLAVKLKFKEIK